MCKSINEFFRREEIMGVKYFTNEDKDKHRKLYYTFYKENEELRVFNGLNEELTLSEVKEIIDGLNDTYINIEEEQYRERTFEQIKYDVETSFAEFYEGPPIKKYFRKDIVRHYKIKCTNCLKEMSTKTEEGYWAAQSWHIHIQGEKFCSEWCVNKYINEIKENTIKERSLRYR